MFGARQTKTYCCCCVRLYQSFSLCRFCAVGFKFFFVRCLCAYGISFVRIQHARKWIGHTNCREPDKDETRILLNILCVLCFGFECFNHTHISCRVALRFVSPFSSLFFLHSVWSWSFLYIFSLIPLDSFLCQMFIISPYTLIFQFFCSVWLVYRHSNFILNIWPMQKTRQYFSYVRCWMQNFWANTVRMAQNSKKKKASNKEHFKLPINAVSVVHFAFPFQRTLFVIQLHSFALQNEHTKKRRIKQ